MRGEFLVWRLDGFSVPALVTTSPDGTDRAQAGAIGYPTTSVLYGDEVLNDDMSLGWRARIGYWLDPLQTHGIELSYLALASIESQFAAESDANGSPILARPFYNVEPGFEGSDAELIAFPGLFSGHIGIAAETRFEAAEILYRGAGCRDCTDRVDFVAGWRWQRLEDSLSFSDSKTVIGQGTGLLVGTTLAETDQFETQNVFNGLELGVLAERQLGSLVIRGRREARSGKKPRPSNRRRFDDGHGSRGRSRRNAGRPAGSTDQHRSAREGVFCRDPRNRSPRGLSLHAQSAGHAWVIHSSTGTPSSGRAT